VLDARALILGSPTLNNGLMPLVADLLCYMKGLRPAGKIGAAFGSYGWSGESVKLITEAMREMKIKMDEEGVLVQFAPGKEDLERCFELARRLARSMIAMESTATTRWQGYWRRPVRFDQCGVAFKSVAAGGNGSSTLRGCAALSRGWQAFRGCCPKKYSSCETIGRTWSPPAREG